MDAPRARLAILARADDGGLGAQTWELWRHLQPVRTLVVMTGATERGTPDLNRYAGPGGWLGKTAARARSGWIIPRLDDEPLQVRTIFDRPEQADARWLLDDVDVVWTAETWYGDAVPSLAAERGVRTVIHANPELWTPDETADRILTATSWLLDRMPPGTTVAPFPVARDRLPERQVAEVRTLYHAASPAMLDRNGTEILLRAVEHMTQEADVIVRGADPRLHGLGRGRRAIVHHVPHHAGPYHEHWPVAADALVLPRRYGGLCLPMQEAASLGLPVVSLDVAPQRGWLHPDLLAPARGRREVRMRGGRTAVYDADPRALARILDRLVSDPALAAAGADVSRTHAAAISWERLAPTYLHLIDRIRQS